MVFFIFFRIQTTSGNTLSQSSRIFIVFWVSSSNIILKFYGQYPFSQLYYCFFQSVSSSYTLHFLCGSWFQSRFLRSYSCWTLYCSEPSQFIIFSDYVDGELTLIYLYLCLLCLDKVGQIQQIVLRTEHVVNITPQRWTVHSSMERMNISQMDTLLYILCK